MVNICGKCQHYTRTETTQDGHYYHYCDKVNEIFPQEQAEGEPSEVPTLKVKFNDAACEYYEKKRRH
jgi:hypothetical protein